jgi:hypothetical protein
MNKGICIIAIAIPLFYMTIVWNKNLRLSKWSSRQVYRVKLENGKDSPTGNLMAEHDKVQEKRIKRIQEVCDKYRDQTDYLKNSSKNMNELFVMSEQSRTIYCYNHKAASQTWLSVYTTFAKQPIHK